MHIDYGVYFTVLALLIPFLILASNWVLEYTGIKSPQKRKDEAYVSFGKTVEQLASDNAAAQLSAAVLLRRYLTLQIEGKPYLRTETINVISSILRTLPTGVYQKTLADGLAYATDLTDADLQRTNLQNIYLGSKTRRINLTSTDLFMSNLSYGLIDNVEARGAIFYNALLYGTIIKNSDFSNANFYGADLTNTKFKDVVLQGANFNKATHVPKEIADRLTDGIFRSDEPVTTVRAACEKTIFFSMPGCMSKTDELTVLAYRQYLVERGYEVIYYNRDTYPQFGQLSQIKTSIEKCAALVAFGTKQTLVREGVYRPGMAGEQPLAENWLSTPWNEVEVGMAVMAGIPVLLVKDEAIESGIFDRVLSETFLSTVLSASDVKELDRNPAIAVWLSQIA